MSGFLEKYGLNRAMLAHLQEFSLLQSEVGTPNLLSELVLNIQKCFIGNLENSTTPFLYAGKYFLLKRHDDKKDLDWNFKMPGFFLSSIGTELMSIVEPEPIKQLSEDLKEFFTEKQLKLVEVELTDENHWKPKL